MANIVQTAPLGIDGIAEQTVKYDAFIGIDPGVGGGLAIIAAGGPLAVSMPDTEQEVWSWIRGYGGVLRPNVFACVELVGGYIKRDGGNPGSAMFTFGQSYGALRMALVAANIPFEAVRPQVWQRALGLSNDKKDTSKTWWKSFLKQQAQELFPQVKVTKATADALLLAQYCKIKWGAA